MEHLAICCADVGSIRRKSFAWYCAEWTGHTPPTPCSNDTKITTLETHVAKHLNDGTPVALGFECPLFVPVPEDPCSLGRARRCEGNRPWSAAAGALALATGLVEAAWILEQLGRRPGAPHLYVTKSDWSTFWNGQGRRLFLWEAFVTGKAKGKSHLHVARTAVLCFAKVLPNPTTAPCQITADRPLSLIAAAAIWAGWPCNPSLIRSACLALRC